MLSLSLAPKGTSQIVKWNTCDDDAARNLGLTPGAEVEVLSSCGGSVIVLVGDRRVALSRDIADRIKV